MKVSRSYRAVIVGLVVILGVLLVILLRPGKSRQETLGPIDQQVQVPTGDSLHPLRIAVVMEPGLFEIDDEGEISGSLPAVADRLLTGISYIWVPVSEKSLGTDLLREKRVDILATQQAFTDLTESSGLLTTDPISSSHYALMSLQDSLSWGDVLSGPSPVEVYYSAEDKEARLILQNLHDISYTAIRPSESDLPPLEMMLEMIKGKIYFAVVKHNLAKEMAERFPQIRVVTDISLEAPQVWLLRSDAESLRDSLNQRISKTDTTE